MKQILYLIVIPVLFTSTLNSSGQSVSISKSVFAPGEKITVTYSGFPGNKQDWISVAQAGSGDGAYLTWKYTNGSTGGTLTFDGLASGNYEIRGYYNNDYVLRTRTPFRVGSMDMNLQVKTRKDTYTPGEKIVVDFSGMPGNTKDWISMAQAGTGEGSYLTWQYTNGSQSGTMEFAGLAAGDYEVRAYFNNESSNIRARNSFKVSTTTTTINTGNPNRLCRRELSVFYAGMGGIGSAWGRAATEPTAMGPGAVADMQAVLGNVKGALTVVKCIGFDQGKIDRLISRLPFLTNTQAVAEIETVIKDLQDVISRVQLDCGNGATLSSLYVTAVHIGAAQAWSSSRMCQPAPMPAAIQTVIRNHLTTAQNAFPAFLPCVPGFQLSQFGVVNVGSANSVEPHINVIMLHTNLLWNIALSDCCCNCR